MREGRLLVKQHDWGTQGDHRANKNSLLKILRYFKPYKRDIFFVILCILFMAVASVIAPLLLRHIVDTAIPKREFGLLNLLVIGMVLVVFGEGIVSMLQTYLNTKVGQGVMFDLHNEMYQHLHKMSIRFSHLPKRVTSCPV